MKLVIIEAPDTSDAGRDERYLHRCVLDCLRRGEAPIAPRRLYASTFDDSRPIEHRLGIAAELAWQQAAQTLIFYQDYGITKDMQAALDLIPSHLGFELRKIGQNP